jgi:hypothetical protein
MRAFKISQESVFMRNRLATLAVVLLVLTSVDLPTPFGGRLSAQNQQPIPFQQLFTQAPPVGSPLSLGAFAPLVNPIPGPDDTFGISMGGEIDFFDPRTGSMRLHFEPYGAFPGPLSFAVGFSRSGSGATTPDLLMVGPLQASNQPLRAFQLFTPPVMIAETPMPQGTGLRVDIADVDADAAAEIILGSGPGSGPPIVTVLAPGRNTSFTFQPFAPTYTGGVSIATGDVTGDGKADILIGQENGNEVRLFDMVGDVIRDRGFFHPYPPTFTGGVRVAAGDVDGDGLADIITAPASGEPLLRVFCPHGPTPIAPVAEFLAFDLALTGGVFVDVGISGGRPVIITTTGNRFAQFEARPNEGVRSMEALLEEIRSGVSYVDANYTVNVGGQIRGQIRTTPLRK